MNYNLYLFGGIQLDITNPFTSNLFFPTFKYFKYFQIFQLFQAPTRRLVPIVSSAWFITISGVEIGERLKFSLSFRRWKFHPKRSTLDIFLTSSFRQLASGMFLIMVRSSDAFRSPLNKGKLQAFFQQGSLWVSSSSKGLFTWRGGPQVGEVTRLAVIEKWNAFTCNLTTLGCRGEVSWGCYCACN